MKKMLIGLGCLLLSGCAMDMDYQRVEEPKVDRYMQQFKFQDYVEEAGKLGIPCAWYSYQMKREVVDKRECKIGVQKYYDTNQHIIKADKWAARDRQLAEHKASMEKLAEKNGRRDKAIRQCEVNFMMTQAYHDDTRSGIENAFIKANTAYQKCLTNVNKEYGDGN